MKIKNGTLLGRAEISEFNPVEIRRLHGEAAADAYCQSFISMLNDLPAGLAALGSIEDMEVGSDDEDSDDEDEECVIM